MPNINKVVFGNTTLIDLTDSTLNDPSQLANGVTAYDRTGTKITGTASGGTAAISVVDTTDSHGGTVRTITALDISDTTAVAADVAQGKYFYTAAGVKTAGTGSGGGGGGLTQHEIHLEFTDSTDTDIEVDYDDSVLGTIITAYNPTGEWHYNNKTVLSASLDNVEWYSYTPIPLNTQLIDYTACTEGYCINENGVAVAQEWCYVTDYTAIAPGMEFSYRAYYWFYIGFYDDSQQPIRTIYVMNDATPDPQDNNVGIGTLSGSKIPSNAKYVRLCGPAAESTYISLIRTA